MYLEVALHGVVDDRPGQVVRGHEAVDGDVPDGRLEVRLLSVHHEVHSALHGTLGGKDEPQVNKLVNDNEKKSEQEISGSLEEEG